ncbi:tetraspanin-18-like [Dreissena polymorpha]|uniref:tetraspanin-18-like n=1 Tax=Dreissena polymorpha TaxID=45954 RepID=UPI002263B7B7|nr:tetraspanin-18-like [Dreissena polymorpha]XP_052258654.1 tetraspanin-18-like [Dreissena polymorpha]XP_052258656.1 tetraspanin-18-like [Dreissena polymorpha]XP_052258657.1 tetraspanin-18-like [Dreissena polymorpha]
MEGLKCSRYLLIFVTTLIFLAGGAFLASGLFFKFNSGFLDKSVVTMFNTVQYSALPMGITCDALSYMMMGMGGLLIMVSMLGMCGALKAIKGCLWVFIVLAVIFIILEGMVIGLWLSVRTKADLWLRGQMLDLLKGYDGPTATDEISSGWNTLFMEARCCGVNALYADGGTNNDFTELPTSWVGGTDRVPASCCQGVTSSTVAVYVTSATCTTVPKNFYTEGCYTRVKFYIDMYSLVTIVAGGVAIVAEVLAIITACIVIDKKKGNQVSVIQANKPPPYVAIDNVISAKKAASHLHKKGNMN